MFIYSLKASIISIKLLKTYFVHRYTLIVVKSNEVIF
jgi:hypothetical protein